MWAHQPLLPAGIQDGVSAHIFTADAGTCAVTGNAAGLLRGVTMAADAGSYAAAAQNAGFSRSLRVSGEPGEFHADAYAVATTTTRRLIADAASMTLSGVEATLHKSTRLLDASIVAHFGCIGQSCGVVVARRLVAEAGAIQMRGQDASRTEPPASGRGPAQLGISIGI